jgi:hypothetical protein
MAYWYATVCHLIGAVIMGLQAGLEAVTEEAGPLRSGEAIMLSQTVAAERQGGGLWFFNASGLLYHCPEEDEERVRLGVAILLTMPLGVQVSRFKYEGRPAHKLTGETLKEAQARLDQGVSQRQVAKAAGVTPGAIQYAIRSGRLKLRPKGKPERTESPGGQSPRERNEEDHAGEGGVAVRRVAERSLAAVGKLDEAQPYFEPAESVARAGVLLAVPVLVAQGVFETFEKVYGGLRNGFYGLNSVVATLALMSLLRIKAPEQISSFAPGEFGRLLGLDRAPEVKTLRRKLLELSRYGQSLALVDAFARKWIEDQGEEVVGFLYVDGHVRPYHGSKHTLPKAWVPRRRMPMQATTDLWVNDTFGDPWFFVTAEANEGMVTLLEGEILPRIQEHLGPEHRRLTMVLDRGGWSRKAFQVREIRCLDESGKRISIVTTREDLPPAEAAARLFARWRQENFFRYMRHEFALDHLPTYAAEPADADRMVDHPARKVRDKELKALKAELAQTLSMLGHHTHAGCDPGSTPQDLKERITALEAAITVTQKARDLLPRRYPFAKSWMKPRSRITDVIKMAAYRAESELATLVGPALGLHHEDEARSFLENAFNLSADLLPDTEQGTLKVRLYGMANPRSNRALAQLCQIMNNQPGYQVCFPRTRLRIVLQPPIVQN